MLDSPADLSFKPAVTPHPKRLTQDQIAQYNREGYVQPFPIFGAEGIAANAAYFDTLVSQMGDDARYAVNCYQARLSGLYDLATNPDILDHVEDIVGPNILCWASAFFAKAPRDPKAVPWHQDAAYWKMSPARTVTVWLAIDDVDAGNSAMRFIPRSHDKGALPIREARGDAVLHLETEGVDEMGTPFSNDLKAGEISLHADMLVHGSLPNMSDRRRCGLTLRYCPPEVEITDDAWATGVEAILCRGQDPTGRWTVHPRPENNDIRNTTSPRNLGTN